MTQEGKFEINDIVIGQEYIGRKYITPGYLAGAKLKVIKKGRKNVSVKHPAYHETFVVSPEHLLPL